LKELDGPDIQVQGSASLLQTLIGSDLVDEFRIWTFPVVVGRGKRLFDDGTVPRELELLSTEAFDTGVILATYCRAGAVEHGSFAFEDPTDAEVERRRKLSGS
jgi:dihydrofolate reductase